MSRRKKIEIFALYFLLITGGLWHLLGWFERLMRWAAAPMLIVLALFLLWKMKTVNRGKETRLFLWAGAVLAGGFFFETIGVKTGLIFGSYEYGDVLQPQISGVPIAIGFAWLGIQICSLGVTQWLFKEKINIYLFATITAGIMVLFDMLMEPSAIYLNYWQWTKGVPPPHNYIGWFVIAMLFSMLGARLHLFHRSLPPFAFHAFIAQAIYFIIILIKSVI